MRILLLTQWFDPEPTIKGLTFAKELIKLGHEVQVLTGYPNYPGGEIYPGYRVKMLQKENIEGISIFRVPLYPSHNSSSVKRILNYISFAISASLLGPFLVKPVDIVYVYHPPATIAIPAIIFKMLRNIPCVYDIQDIWPDTLTATGMISNKLLLWCINIWCLIAYKMVDHIVVLSPGFKKILHDRGVSSDKISVIYNWCDEANIAPMSQLDALQSEPQLVGRFNVVFAGTMGKAQSLEVILDAAEILAIKLSHVQFVFVGGGIEVEHLKQKAIDNQINNVIFLPRRHASEISSLLCAADALLVHLKDDPLFEITVPSKTQTYLAMGRPIIMALRGDAADLIERAGAGLVCQPGNVTSIVSAVEALIGMSSCGRDELGKSGAHFYENELSVQEGSRKFELIFRKLVE